MNDEKELLDPTKFPAAWYVLVLVVGTFAGLTRYLLMMRAEPSFTWSWVSLLIEVVVSGFVAVMTFWAALRYLDFDVLAAVFWSGVASHFGVRIIAVAERVVSKQTDYFLGFKLPRNRDDSDGKN